MLLRVGERLLREAEQREQKGNFLTRLRARLPTWGRRQQDDPDWLIRLPEDAGEGEDGTGRAVGGDGAAAGAAAAVRLERDIEELVARTKVRMVNTSLQPPLPPHHQASMTHDPAAGLRLSS